MKRVPAWQGVAAQVESVLQVLECNLASRAIGLVLGHEAIDLVRDQTAHRGGPARREHLGLPDGLFVQLERQVSFHRDKATTSRLWPTQMTWPGLRSEAAPVLLP